MKALLFILVFCVFNVSGMNREVMPLEHYGNLECGEERKKAIIICALFFSHQYEVMQSSIKEKIYKIDHYRAYKEPEQQSNGHKAVLICSAQEIRVIAKDFLKQMDDKALGSNIKEQAKIKENDSYFCDKVHFYRLKILEQFNVQLDCREYEEDEKNTSMLESVAKKLF